MASLIDKIRPKLSGQIMQALNWSSQMILMQKSPEVPWNNFGMMVRRFESKLLMTVTLRRVVASDSNTRPLDRTLKPENFKARIRLGLERSFIRPFISISLW